jgi:hypothetical protein
VEERGGGGSAQARACVYIKDEVGSMDGKHTAKRGSVRGARGGQQSISTTVLETTAESAPTHPTRAHWGTGQISARKRRVEPPELEEDEK